MGFTTYLSAAKGTDEGGLPRLFLIDNTTNVDGNGCARDILAVITTEDASGYKNGDTPIGIQVTEGWHNVVVAVSEGTYTEYLLTVNIKMVKVNLALQLRVLRLVRFNISSSNSSSKLCS